MLKTKLKVLKRSEIIIKERFRKDYGDIETLADSIKEQGIIQPVAVNNKFELQDGGRRMAAAELAGLDAIPAIVIDTDGELTERTIELIANIHRKDFSWQERVALTNELHRLSKEQDPKWTQTKTALAIGRSIGGINRHLELGEAMQILPELADCKNEDDAVKTWKRAQEKLATQFLRQKQKEEMESTTEDTDDEDETTAPPEAAAKIYRYANEHYKIGDAFDGMVEMCEYYSKHGGSPIRFIECDPPYAIDLQDSKRNATHNTDYNEIPREDYPTFLKKLASHTYKIAARDSWMVFWFGPTWFTETKAALSKAGWTVGDIPAIWTKRTGQTNSPDTNLANCYEPFFICRKGKPILAKPGTSNIFQFDAVPSSRKYHPTQRPVELIQAIYETFAFPGSLSFIPFLGSGTSIIAAYRLGINAFGFDLSDYYKDRFLLEVTKDAE